MRPRKRDEIVSSELTRVLSPMLPVVSRVSRCAARAPPGPEEGLPTGN